MNDLLFSNQKSLGAEDLVNHAGALGLDQMKFRECLDSGRQAAETAKDAEEGRKAGITGTPAFLFGFVQPDGKSVKAVKMLKGAQPYSAFKEAIDGMLAPQKK